MAIVEKYDWGEKIRRDTDLKQLKLLKKGVKYWNEWIEEKEVSINLYKADLSGMDLHGAYLSGADLGKASLDNANLSNAQMYGATLDEASLKGANLSDAKLKGADLSGANLSKADLSGAELQRARLDSCNLTGAKLVRVKMNDAYLVNANFTGADLSQCRLPNADLTRANLKKAKLKEAILYEANLTQTNLKGANLTGADLQKAILVETILQDAILNNCSVYGLSAWALQGSPKKQSGLLITQEGEPEITVDDLQVAQFIYLLLNRENLRKVIDTISSKAVLILGRFTPERKMILETLAGELRKHQLLPVIFDFEKPTSRDFTETIKTLAGISLFVIADITNPKSAPLELQATVPDYQIPFLPIIQEGEEPFSMLSDLVGKYDWVLQPIIKYKSAEQLKAAFKEAIIDRAWEKYKQLQKKKNTVIQTASIDDFLKKI